MKKPDTPQNEASRLQALRSLNVLDMRSEERFDRLTRLAKRLFDVPIALVSLVDENRQWFKSYVGLKVRETPRDISFCGHAILGSAIFLINDTKIDERFADNPLVLNEPYIRFYAGCPLRSFDGSALGTLCLIDTRPRQFIDSDLAALKDLAELAENELMAIQLATLDELTKLSNRRGFIRLAEQTLEICARQNIPASLIFLDMNNFKDINDRFGHAEGDLALVNFAEQLTNSFRDSDVLGRLGGDEFVILLVETSGEPAEATINKFRNRINEFSSKANRGYQLSFSEGVVAVDNKKKKSIEALLSQADSLMYENKQASQNDQDS